MYTKVKITNEQERAMEIARVALMTQTPFFAHYYYSEMIEHPTLDIPTAATDGRRIFYNPEYLAGLKPPERVFVLAHEVHHTVSRHPQRMKHYRNGGGLRGKDWQPELFNVCADYTINADLIESDIGLCNPAWLYDSTVKSTDLVEDVYVKKHKPPQKGQGQNQAYGQKTRGGTPDQRAQAAGGAFDEVLEPDTDPVTGKEDIPSESEFREAIARAAGAAKAMGKMPASMQKLVDEILEPQVSWRERIRMLVTGKIGSRKESWDRPNRRRLVLNPIVIMPGRRGFGANDVVVVIDSSGSIYADEKALSAFFSELGGIMADVRPKRIVLIHADAAVQRVDEARNLDEISHYRAQGTRGGGGTDFRPAFKYVAEQGIRPDALVYLTDMYGSFPSEAPGYPVIWCSITDEVGPFGETVKIEV